MIQEMLEVRIAAGSADEAAVIADALVAERLAACVQVIPAIRSSYLWQGAVESADEVLLTAKTTAGRFDQLAARVRELHSYDVPEIVGTPITHADESYAEWLRAAVHPAQGPPQAHIETERKFELPEGRPAPDPLEWPDVDQLGEPVGHHLRALYYDTPDVRLAQRGISLRRRTGGADDGWHLKLPRGGDSRLEHWLPLDAGEQPPATFVGQLRDVLDGAELQPICEVETRRSEREVSGRGVVLADVCEDYVWTRNLLDPSLDRAWRELEVELRHGGSEFLERVSAHLQAGGVRQAAIASKVRTALGHLLPQVAS
ncbi:divalent cation tolerance protein CutA [Flexivirga meconopsidis]|uniref:divalent cation tolerance protein CutA n=1 Tax=Flexivirga meconopsidis TaxID=2977121 RepID=UPI00224085FB